MIAIDHDVHSLKSQAEYKKRGMDEPCSKISISLRGFVMQPASDEMRPKAGKRESGKGGTTSLRRGEEARLDYFSLPRANDMNASIIKTGYP